MVASFMSGPGLDLAGKHGRTTMIRKKWHDGEPVLSVETEDEFWKALTTGEAVELTWEFGEQIGKVVDKFEKTAWAGLEPDRYAWSAIEHRGAGGGIHVHVLAARVDLETGKSLNIAAPGWQKTFDALRDWQNHENGWSCPDDPERARDLQPGHRAYIEAAQVRSGLAAEKDPRRLITDYLGQRIESGSVSDRSSMGWSCPDLVDT